ncbi:MAG: TPM domain-containing protein, partial [Saprospiraceae bacterium]|nr:TPM domain-containing protein [Saprospiraceae bacterium]
MSLRLTVLLFLSVLSLSALQAKEPPARPNPPRLVNDFVGLLDGGQADALERKLVAYNDSTSTQIAVVIESTIDGDDVFEYSYRLARAWGIGQKEKDNGILIFVAFEDRKLYIVTGYGAEGFLPDAMAKRIIENIIKPAFREGRYYPGLDEAANIIMQLGSGEYTAEPRKEGGGGFPWMTILIILALLIFLSMFMGQGGNHHRNDDERKAAHCAKDEVVGRQQKSGEQHESARHQQADPPGGAQQDGKQRPLGHAEFHHSAPDPTVSDRRPCTSCRCRPHRAASVASCVTSTKAMPCSRARPSISSNTPSAVTRSRLPVGSSASTQAGRVT